MLEIACTYVYVGPAGQSCSPCFMRPPRVLTFVTHTAIKMHSGFAEQKDSMEICDTASSLWTSLPMGNDRAFL